MSQITVMDPLGGPGQAQGLRRLRYLAVVAPNLPPAFEPEPSPEEGLLEALLRWLEGPNAVLVVPPGTVVLALDPDTGKCVWSTGDVSGAAAGEVPPCNS